MLYTTYLVLNSVLTNVLIPLIKSCYWCCCLHPPLDASKSIGFVKLGKKHGKSRGNGCGESPDYLSEKYVNLSPFLVLTHTRSLFDKRRFILLSKLAQL